MEPIIIERDAPYFTFNVIQGDKSSGCLGFDEMLGLVAALTMPNHRPSRQWMKTKEEHDAWRNSLSHTEKPLDGIHDVEFENESNG